jgi:hypothetical protein
MIIDFTQAEWQPGYIGGFTGGHHVPEALTKRQATNDQHAAQGLRRFNPLGECYIYVKATAAITAGQPCYVTDYEATVPTSGSLMYTVKPAIQTVGATFTGANSVSLYPFATNQFGLVRLFACAVSGTARVLTDGTSILGTGVLENPLKVGALPLSSVDDDTLTVASGKIKLKKVYVNGAQFDGDGSSDATPITFKV